MGQGLAKEKLGLAADAPISMAQLNSKISSKSVATPLSSDATALSMSAGLPGLDVSGWQADPATHSLSTVDWKRQWSLGARFVYTKATEGNNFKDASRTSHLKGATGVGMLHGAYHFALPNQSSAISQADFFVKNGGAWKADGNTLPPLLDCTGNSSAFMNQPLHIAAYGAPYPWMPGGWKTYSMWQFSSTGPLAGDSNVWNGTLASLNTFARGPGPKSVVTRMDGKDRYEVSAAVSKATFPAGTQTAYIASGAIYTDALSGSAAAGHVGSPVLLTATDVLPDAIRTELQRLKPRRIIILGGAASVSNSVMTLLRNYASEVTRMDGKDRYEVSATVSRSTYWVGTQVAYIASGAIYTDALSGSAAAAHNGAPILLTAPNVLPNVIAAELKRLKPQKIVILGGSGTVSNNVMTLLRKYAPTVTRMNGKDRYEVSAAVSKATFPVGTKTAYIASGAIYTDALSGSAAAGHVDGPVLLTAHHGLPAVIIAELKRLKPNKIVVLGGSGTISNDVQAKLKQYLR